MQLSNKATTISRRAFSLATMGTLAALAIPGLAFSKRQDQDQDKEKEKVVDLKAELAGKESQKWQLDLIKTDEKEYTSEHFDKDGEFEKTDLAQLVPCQLTFNANGTCEMLYASAYKDGKLVPNDLKAKGKWAVDAKDKKKVKLIEDANDDKKIDEEHDEVIWFKAVKLEEDVFTCKFSLQGDYTGGVEKLQYTKVEDEIK